MTEKQFFHRDELPKFPTRQETIDWLDAEIAKYDRKLKKRDPERYELRKFLRESGYIYLGQL